MNTEGAFRFSCYSVYLCLERKQNRSEKRNKNQRLSLKSFPSSYQGTFYFPTQTGVVDSLIGQPNFGALFYSSLSRSCFLPKWFHHAVFLGCWIWLGVRNSTPGMIFCVSCTREVWGAPKLHERWLVVVPRVPHGQIWIVSQVYLGFSVWTIEISATVEMSHLHRQLRLWTQNFDIKFNVRSRFLS